MLLISDILKTSLPVQYHHKIDKIRNLNILQNLDTDYKRMQFFQKTNALVQPTKFLIGEINDN